jgi:hypothetical protein
VAPVWGRRRKPQSDMEAQRALAIVARLTESGVSLWLDGGWGVDALLGSQTRPHDDLDLIVRLDDVRQLEDALGHSGYVRVHGAPPLSLELTDPDGHQIDVHPVRFNDGGEGSIECKTASTGFIRPARSPRWARSWIATFHARRRGCRCWRTPLDMRSMRRASRRR